MQAICKLSRFRFASGAEEKIVRTFQAPANFIENFKNLCSISSGEIDAIIECKLIDAFSNIFCSPKKTDFQYFCLSAATPKGASVPSLGLSNKAVYDESIPTDTDKRHIKDQYPDNYFVPISMEGEYSPQSNHILFSRKYN